MPESSAAGASPATARSCGVLVADDELDIREALSSGLQREGFAVWSAADGREALDLYRAHSANIDVVLLDLRMPRLNGPATLAALQKLAPQIPCCFMSGYLGHHTDAELLERGAQAIVIKPLRMPELAQLLREAAGKRESTHTIVSQRKIFGGSAPPGQRARG